MIRNLPFVLLLLLGILANAQITLSGILLDSSTLEPLPNAFIQVGEKWNSISNKKGEFVVTNIKNGTHVFFASHVGCKSITQNLNLDKDTFITVYLAHHVHQFEQVVAYGHQSGTEPDARFKELVTAHQLEQKGAITLADALSQLNGVNFLKTGPSIAKPIINGMHSNRVLVINGETTQEGQQWGTEHAPEIDPLSTGKLELIKGAGTLLYGGDGIGGIILLLPNSFSDTTSSKVQLIAKGETNNSSGQIGLKLENYNLEKKWGNRLTINTKRAGDSHAPNYVLSNTGFSQLSSTYFSKKQWNEHSLQFTASAFNQRIGILQASHIGNLSDLNRALNSDTPLILNPATFTINRPFQYIQHYAGKLKWAYQDAHSGKILANYTFQYNQRQEFDNHNYNDDASLDLQLQTHQLYIVVDKHFQSLRLQYGASGELQENIFQGRFFIPNYRRLKTAIFGIATFEKSNYLLETGVRFDNQNTATYRYVGNTLTKEDFIFGGISATAGGWRKWGEDFQIHFGVASKMRAPEINELFSNGLHHGSASLEFGDLSLKQERSYSVNAALHYNHNRLRIVAEPYLHYFDNYIYLKPSGETQLTIRGAFPVFKYIQTNARYAGVDATFNYWLSSQWSLATTASLTYAKDVVRNEFIYGIPAQRLGGKLQYAAAEGLGLQDITFSAKPSYTLQQNRVELNQDFTASPDGYFLLDAELGANYRNTPMYFLLSINNILNQEYRDYLNRYRYFAAETGINISLTINYTFK